MKPIILTGDRPTGPLHLGHYVGSLKNRVSLQKDFQEFLIIADAQALTDNFERPELVHENVLQVALDYLAVGLDPDQNVLFIQSQIPELPQLTAYFMNLVTVARLQRNPTIKEEITQKGLEDRLPVGFFCYPISQAADILAFSADAVPIGEDQRPMIEQANEIARKFNSVYRTSCFKEVQGIVGSIGRLPGIDGKAKMSKSLGNAIFLGDSNDELRRKVNLMFTDPNHLRVEDPGTVEGHVVFLFLDYFDTDKAALEDLKARYRHGGVGDGVVKKRLVSVLDELLSPIRIRRQQYEEDLGYVRDVLKRGSERARDVASRKLRDAKEAMKILY